MRLFLLLFFSLVYASHANASVYVYPDGSTSTFDDTSKLNAMCAPESWGSRSPTAPTLSSAVCTNATAYAVVSWPSSNACGTYHVCDTYVPPAPPDPCASKAGTQAIPSGQFAMGTTSGPYNPASSTSCIKDADGCAITPVLGQWRQAPTTNGPVGTDNLVVMAQATYTGKTADLTTCTKPLTITVQPAGTVAPDTVPPNSGGAAPTGPSDCPPGTGFAQINSQTMCLKSGTNVQTSSQSSTDAAGNKTSSTVTQTVNADGSITITATGSDGSSSSSTAPNGGAGLGGQSGQNGNNDNGGGFGPPPTWSDGTDAGTGTDPAVGALPSTLAPEIHHVYMSESGVCPIVDKTIQIGPVAVNLPFSVVCNYIIYFRWAIIAMAALVTLRLYALAPW